MMPSFKVKHTHDVVHDIICRNESCSKFGLPWSEHIISRDAIKDNLWYVEHF